MRCEGCGLIGLNVVYKQIRVTNGVLTLCEQCLADVNRKNPEVARLASRVQALEEALRIYGIHRIACAHSERPAKDCDCGLAAAYKGQPDRRQDMGSRADNIKDQEPPHIRGA